MPIINKKDEKEYIVGDIVKLDDNITAEIIFVDPDENMPPPYLVKVNKKDVKAKGNITNYITYQQIKEDWKDYKTSIPFSKTLIAPGKEFLYQWVDDFNLELLTRANTVERIIVDINKELNGK